ncbi:MAG: DUF1963 domain-containing protein [Planctomycetes bacterium]|nr:DUF1963 domain-containing protein [Planctomycetota bacterium]
MPPKPTLPEPAATLPGEADILASVLANLGDDTAKLVYADWLDEHDDPRGKLLRNAVTAFRDGKKMPSVPSKFKTWADLVGIDLMRRLWSKTTTPFASTVLNLAKPALCVISTKAAEAKIPVGASKFGGGPDLPPNAKWPVFRGNPLSFLAQFNLAELAASPACRELPAMGMLSIFAHYDEDEGNDDFPKGSWKLLYFPDPSKLTRHLPPEVSFQSCRLSFTEFLAVPDADSPWFKELGFDIDSDAGYRERRAYRDQFVGDPCHRVLGYPVSIQNDSLGKKTMRHLLTLDTDDTAGWGWGDGGSLYFTMSEGDLKAHRFDRVQMEMQSG